MTGSASVSTPAAVPKRRAPDFFIVGHPKSGTTALHRMLRANPQIHMPRKEPGFFVPELRSRRTKDRFAGGVEDYLALFDGAAPEQLIGEATTAYLWSRTAAGRIAELQPQARIVAILREPASFLHSLHLQFLQSNVENETDLRRALALEQPRREGRQLPPYSTRAPALLYSEHVRYVEQLQRYHAVFAPEQVLVLIYDDFRADNERTLRAVLRFLGIDDAPAVGAIEANPTVGVRSQRVYDLVRALYLGRSPRTRAAKSAIKTLAPQRVRHQALAATRRMQWTSPPAPDVELMRELRHRFKGEVEALADYLERDLLALWGYDGLD